MKYLILLCAFTLTFSGLDAQTAVSTTGMKKRQYVALSSVAAKKIDPSKLPKGLKISGNKIIPARGYIFVGKKNINIVLGTQFIKILGIGSDGVVTPNYKVITSGRLGSKDGDYYVVCSCGSNVFETEGDDCQPSLSNGQLACVGPCTGRNEGSSCSMKGFHVMDNGTITRVPD